ncbi:FBD-associated F-box protein At3g49020-like [Rhododendron vialii]|uniref:FBD-associated F-box protein At3g49020-like n=1 Tax=Rhododendron vialii TaxID=182163 RepID=UPI00265DD88B|nr:FBD-associated F-box protein At3g49020-like [Rhododendron vialii]
MGSTSISCKLSEEVKLNEAEDRISNLPEDIMVCTLSLLPTNYAVATSILSTKWKRMWTSITDLDIEFLDSKGRGSRCEKSFVKFVHHVLLSLDGSNLDGFRVSCEGVSPCFKASHVKSWVTTRQQFHVVLKLGYCFFLPVPSLVRLQNLKTLLLHSAVFRDGDSAYRLISSCPVLEDLSLIKCRGRDFRLLKISAPLLKRLVVSYLEPACYWPDDVLYHTFELYSFDNTEEPDEDDFKLSFEFLLHQTLKLPTFHNLTRLELGVNNRVRWVLLPYLLESSPNLTSLVFVEGLLHYYRYGDSDPGIWDWHPPENVPACLLFSLETLDIRKFQGQQRELKIVKYFLSNAKSLKTLSISCEKRKMKREMLEVRRELLETPRGSRICEVVVS